MQREIVTILALFGIFCALGAPVVDTRPVCGSAGWCVWLSVAVRRGGCGGALVRARRGEAEGAAEHELLWSNITDRVRHDI